MRTIFDFQQYKNIFEWKKIQNFEAGLFFLIQGFFDPPDFIPKQKQSEIKDWKGNENYFLALKY